MERSVVTVDLTTEQRSDVIIAFLEVGVPYTAVARALRLDPEYVKGALDLMHVEEYGTDDLAAAMAYLQWVAYEEALNQIQRGTPASKARFIQLVLARSVGLAGKSDPGQSEKIRETFAAMTADLQPPGKEAAGIYESEK
jgi:hypothetical protein